MLNKIFIVIKKLTIQVKTIKFKKLQNKKAQYYEILSKNQKANKINISNFIIHDYQIIIKYN